MKKQLIINIIKPVLIILSLLQLTSCATLFTRKERILDMKPAITVANIIPIPAEMNLTGKFFRLDQNSKIFFHLSSTEIEFIASYLQENIRTILGYEIQFQHKKDNLSKRNIYLNLRSDYKNLGEEGYILKITESSITLEANKPEGLFRGVQTIIQLLFPFKVQNNFIPSEIQIPTLEIVDYPRFQWRGVMLDVARHFFKVNDVKKLIDLIALYKFNRLHLHLTDDQGWRIQINSWPNLTIVGGSTQVGGGAGGFFTQEEYSEIVRYAQQRYIVLVPEIDMPGHTNAALASYPELNCDDVAPPLYTGIKVGFSSLCIGKEITYDFVRDVIKEVSELTPGEYFHIGGDEALATDSIDYNNFIQRVQEIVNANGKKMLGWQEIAQSKLKSNTIIQYWRESKHLLEGIKQGVKIIMSPSNRAYMDMKYNPDTQLGLNWAGYIEVSDSYNWDPITQLNNLNEDQILGVEAPLWTETILKFSDIEFMLFPRLPGIAEICWSPKDKRSWEEYRIRLSYHGKYWEQLGMNFYKSPQINWE